MAKAQFADDNKYRDNPKLIAKHLNHALATGDHDTIVQAIGEMIRAQGSSRFSKKHKLSREGLYRSFSGPQSPRLERVLDVLLALDVKLIVKPVVK